ncbi:DNA-processing protein DprA [[Phormidium] sp. ETS-05]|uniref:DNA-processing protein DprA n=1 Tax=[Phormidium] sp. ETS-05 TaxID=222819 RepID=UPI001E28C12C|nr:DNA-processing protein DprA [[Phormidium] sp. ETS-05]
MNIDSHILPPDTQAILLLCASFGQNRQESASPLTTGEYSELAKWLRSMQMKPADLLTPTGINSLAQLNHPKLPPERLMALLERGGMLALAVEKWTNQGIWILARSDRHYPPRLKHHLQHLAPPLLYGVGPQSRLLDGGLAIVGSREIDEEVLTFTRTVAHTCAEQGMQVVSGGAKGVDSEAMLGAIDAGGTAVGILANSLTKAAVSQQFRASIRAAKLTLISPYDPDAGFTVGTAMGRNKYIYALADYALVISSSFGSGGTWAGATEVLRHYHEIPLFVRTQGHIPQGNQELLKMGAKPFPPMPWHQPLHSLLADTSSATEPQPVAPPETAKIPPSPPTTAKDIYEAVLPFILAELHQPRDAKSLAADLNLRSGQLEDWLNRAVAEGKVEKTKKPVRYIINQSVPQSVTQLSLLD